MSKQEILTKAIELAIAGGWKPFKDTEQWRVINPNADYVSFVTPDYSSFDSHNYHKLLPEQIIYNHEFAKALWGESMVYFTDGCPIGEHKSLVGQDESPYYEPHGEAYKYHLQQMVIADDPIAYLGEHI